MKTSPVEKKMLETLEKTVSAAGFTLNLAFLSKAGKEDDGVLAIVEGSVETLGKQIASLFEQHPELKFVTEFILKTGGICKHTKGKTKKGKKK